MNKKKQNIIIAFIAIFFLCVICVCIHKINEINNYGTEGIVNNINNNEEEETIDYVALTNTITKTTMQANITIINKSYNTFLFIESNSCTSLGSGIIFSENKDNYYFALTNNHVTVKTNGYSKQNLTVKDYKGNEYEAIKYHESADYDLAVVYFKKKIELTKIKIESNNLNINDEIVALGQPGGQNNALTWGKIINYKKITLNNTPTYQSNVKFNVITHDAPIDGGSSGGAVLSINLKLAGINYGGCEDSNNEFVYACAIPAEKINEYLNKYIYN